MSKGSRDRTRNKAEYDKGHDGIAWNSRKDRDRVARLAVKEAIRNETIKSE